jgi:hypothetical protein
VEFLANKLLRQKKNHNITCKWHINHYQVEFPVQEMWTEIEHNQNTHSRWNFF